MSKSLTLSMSLALALGFSLASAFVYVRQVLYAGELRREAAREQFRREQELLNAQHRAQLEQLAMHTDATSST